MKGDVQSAPLFGAQRRIIAHIRVFT